MLKTYLALLTEISRNLLRNARESPVLYFWFGCMLFLSLAMFAVLTVFMVMNEVDVNVNDLVLSMCFLFLFKSSADFHRYYSTASTLTYPFSTQVSQKKTVFEVFLVVFWVNLGIFVLFSSLYTIFLGIQGVHLSYPIEYLQILLGVFLGLILGPAFTIHFFSTKRIRLLPVSFILAGFWFFRSIPALLILIFCALVYLVWSHGFLLDSYQYVARKKRQQEQLQVHIHTIRRAIFHKETIILWRDKLLPSFVFTASLIGGFTGYLTVYGENLFIPEQFQEMAQSFLPAAYVMLGIYIVVIYTAVFPTVGMFLNEEHTLWILHHLPVKEKTVVEGKTFALTLPFIASLPFLAYYTAFTGTEHLLFSLWFLPFAYLAGVIISLPIGVKYLGKKSDILVLYSVALLVFVILSAGIGLEQVFETSLTSRLLFYMTSLLLELGLLMISIALASRGLSIKYKQHSTTQLSSRSSP
ncbi:MAG: hypothetical protein V1726_07255 [Methanobacteriota archaeon]